MSEQISVSLFEHFSALPDPRVDRTKRHVLLDMIGLSICAVICGVEDWTTLEEFDHNKEVWLRQFFAFPNGIPSDSTIRQVFPWLSLRGYYQYYGIRGNYDSVYRVYYTLRFAWWRLLNRRSQKGYIN